MLTVGYLLAQRYRLGHQIAVGGMGEVWEAEDTRLGRQVAIKVLKQELTGDPEFRHRFQTEARMTASLNHPGIAGVHDYGETVTMSYRAQGGHHRQAEADTAYLVMELVAGDSLANIILQQPRLPVDQTLDILAQAADALQAAHERGLVHRDVKPGNILITPTGRVKLTDFGIAKAVDAAPVTRQGMVMGTAHYIAPEQAAGDEAGPASDIYSLGVVGYECLAGTRPFRSDNSLTVAMMHVHDAPPPLPSDVPPQVRELIETTLVKDPRQRYRTGSEFGAAVAAVSSGRRPPLPSGLAGAAATGAVTTELMGRPTPQTALLPPGAGYERATGPRQAGPPPPTGRYPEDLPDQQDASKRRSGTRVAIVVALLGVLGLVLGTYGIREAMRTDTTPGADSATVAPPQQAPQAPLTQAPPPTRHHKPVTSAAPRTKTTEPTPDTTTTVQSADVFVVATDYLGRTGSAAASKAEDNGLRPEVVGGNGDEVSADKQSDCRVTSVDPGAGFVSPGSTVKLTCRGFG
jgi:serine/threonine-protein kinase